MGRKIFLETESPSGALSIILSSRSGRKPDIAICLDEVSNSYIEALPRQSAQDVIDTFQEKSGSKEDLACDILMGPVTILDSPGQNPLFLTQAYKR